MRPDERLASPPTLRTHSPEQIERAWWQHVARPDVRQLSPLALLTGALLGAVMGLSNLYVGLKLGWSLGVVVTASIVGWSAWSVARRLRLLRREPTVLEANAMASTASAAGYSTGTTLASAMAAHLMVTGHVLPLWQLLVWVLSISVLGLCVAIPLRRRLVIVEQLPFPTGAAAAQTLQSLHAEPGPATRRARALVVALGVGIIVKCLTAVVPWLATHAGPDSVLHWFVVPAAVPTEGMQQALPLLAAAVGYGWALQLSVLLPAAGLLMGWRATWSLLLGAIVCFGVLAPALVDAGVVAGPDFRSVSAWTVWPGATLMVIAGSWTMLARLPSVFRWLASRDDTPRRNADDAAHDDTGRWPNSAKGDIPARWAAAGIGLAGAVCVLAQLLLFEIPLVVAIVAVVLALGLAVVAARVTGETDITPVGPLGKLAQLSGGVLMPGRVAPNLLAASVTAGAAASCADLLTDLKSGAVLGATPRKQFIAQAVGVLVGVAVVVPVFRYAIAPQADALGGDQWPAPAAAIWASVSRVVGQGLDSIPSGAGLAIAVAATIAVALGALERARPQWRAWVPSGAGLGLAFVLPPSNALSFAIGGLVGWLVARRQPAAVVSHMVPIAAGLIAGESLAGIADALFRVLWG